MGSNVPIDPSDILSNRSAMSKDNILRAFRISSAPSDATITMKTTKPPASLVKEASILPHLFITPRCSCGVMTMYLELLADDFIRNMQPYRCDLNNNIRLPLFLKIVDDPCLLS